MQIINSRLLQIHFIRTQRKNHRIVSKYFSKAHELCSKIENHFRFAFMKIGVNSQHTNCVVSLVLTLYFQVKFVNSHHHILKKTHTHTKYKQRYTPRTHRLQRTQLDKPQGATQFVNLRVLASLRATDLPIIKYVKDLFD